MGNVGAGIRHPLRYRPRLAALAMEAIATWADVELFMLDLYIHLAGGKDDLAADLFLAMETRTAKSQAINVLIKRNVPEARDKLALNALLAQIKSAAGERDRLAHWVWGVSADLPGALLLTDPRKMLGNKIADSDKLVYRKADFESIITNHSRLATAGAMFFHYHRGGPSPTSEYLFGLLCDRLGIPDTERRQA